MKTSEEIYARILTDSTLTINKFVISYWDSIKKKHIDVPVSNWKPIKNGGDVPWHRVTYIKFNGTIVWDRENKINNIDSCVEAIENNHLGKSFKIVTFNVMSDIYQSKMTDMSTRANKIFDYLKQTKAEIICLQEIQKKFLALLKENFKEYNICHTNVGTNDVVIMSKYKPNSCDTIEFNETKHALAITLNMADGNQILFVGIHLTSDFRGSAKETRSSQLFQIKKYVDQHNLPFVIIGDTNDSGSNLYHFDDIKDAWKELKDDQSGYTYDPFKNELAKILSTKGVSGRLDKICYKSNNIISCSDVTLMDFIHLSDHFPLEASFKLDEIIESHCQDDKELTNQTALCIIPPYELWADLPIHDDRQVCDPLLARWMPHINIFWGFVNTAKFASYAHIINNLNIQPFEVIFDTLDTFEHEKTTTIFLKPNPESLLKIRQMYTTLNTIFKESNIYNPHLTLGNYDKDSKKLESFMKRKFSFRWTIDKIYMITRQDCEYFRVGEIIKFTNNKYTSEEILTFLSNVRPTYEYIQCGSHYLGVADDDSDIDLLCVGQDQEDRQEYITRVKKILDQCGKFNSVINVSNQHTMCLKINSDISIDIHYINKSRLNVPLQELSDFDNNSLSLLAEPKEILRHMEGKHELFRECLVWLRKSLRECNMYGQTFGYLGGLSLALLTSFVIKENNVLDLDNFKKYLADTNFDKVISLNVHKGESLSVYVEKNFRNGSDKLMVILRSTYPHENMIRTITQSTKKLLVSKFKSSFLCANPSYEYFLTIIIDSNSKSSLKDAMSWFSRIIPRINVLMEKNVGAGIFPENKFTTKYNEASNNYVAGWTVYVSVATSYIENIKYDLLTKSRESLFNVNTNIITKST